MASSSALYLGMVRAWFLSLTITIEVSLSARPNIIMILADDLGWNDVSFHGSDQIPTPNIDALAYNGIVLNHHYVPALCTPSRSALLTGKYPTSLGMQHLVILEPEPWGLPLNETLLPERLQKHGYFTHAIGKWHLGYCKKAYTPTYRGFDTFYGYYNGYQSYYDHSVVSTLEAYEGYDMRRNMDVDFSAKGKYSTDIFTDEAVNIINNHNSSEGPLFLYFSHLAPHAGNEDDPLEAPEEEIAKFSYITDVERRIYAAMVSKLDQSVGRVMAALKSKGLLENSIVLFMADNGAPTFGIHSNRGSNYPLRGLKETPWEGGIRGSAAIWSPMLKKTKRVSNQILYIADWLPTLFSAVGLNPSELGPIDGKDMWNVLSNNLESPRTEVFHNYDEIDNYSSLRIGDWKYVSGTTMDGEADGWYGDSGADISTPPYDTYAVLNSETNKAINGLSKANEQQRRSNLDNLTKDIITVGDIMELRSTSTVLCGINRTPPETIFSFGRLHNSTNINIKENETDKKHDMLENISCNPLEEPCLFYLPQDPCEELNLAHIYPTIFAEMENRLKELKKAVVKPLNKPGDPEANPALHNNIWISWLDELSAETDPSIKRLTEKENLSLTTSIETNHLLANFRENPMRFAIMLLLSISAAMITRAFAKSWFPLLGNSKIL